ncbi:helix-turn-helix domain-containing protein [Acetobacter tropicalis]|uniref:helix-turn-helix domain-containing protein n=1 Tax=Acetobacter tropicalis TaxID=104102 RepID=UPI001656FF4D|nr:LysR family transcriptional regulator [Acetobacter tropicalis]MBC9009723.1 LysR family transcriptional regulator [Acetobacter tropicalis]
MSIFLATVEAGGFAPAAECLGLSRSAVAKIIGRIEHLLGVKRWSRPFGQFCGLDKLYPVVVMPPF